jgi:gluconate:H+ symporter, GntP family
MSSDFALIGATTISIIGLIVLITRFKVHAFLALIIASIFLGLTAGLAPDTVVTNFATGFGDVMKSVGIVVGLGTMLGAMLVYSGGADKFANALISLGGKKLVPWTTFFAALLIGLPLFFEVGFVLLVPLAFAIAKRMNESVLKVGLPLLAGLSVAHGLVPPHPGPMLAVSAYQADVGKTIILGLIVGVPTGLIAGPLFASIITRWINPVATAREVDERQSIENAARPIGKAPSLVAVIITILLPPVLMMGRSIVAATRLTGQGASVINFFGEPVTALLFALLFAIATLGLLRGQRMAEIQKILEKSLLPVAAVILVVGAGGGFKQILIAAKVGDLIGRWAAGAHLSPLLLGWIAAAVVRIATGSATVATITGVGILTPILSQYPHVSRELMVLATGCGSLVLSHVNDAGFWLVKEYFGLSLQDTFKSWTVMETLLSVIGLIFVLILGSFGI